MPEPSDDPQPSEPTATQHRRERPDARFVERARALIERHRELLDRLAE